MSTEELETVKDAVRVADDIEEIYELMDEWNVQMPKSSGGYVSPESLKQACEELQSIAESGVLLQNLDDSRHSSYFTRFTRQKGIRPDVREKYQEIAENNLEDMEERHQD